MPTTLLTGGNGFVGATVLDRLLAQDHKVIAAVRTRASGDKLLSAHDEWDKSRIEFAEIPDFGATGAFDSVFQDHPEIDYVIHVAAPILDPANTDFVEHYEKPTVGGNINLLQAAKKYGKNVKAIAVTGSINAITTGDQNDVKSRVFDGSQWLPLGKEDAIQMNNPFVRTSRPP
jgi:nucleoside-diphosphate-sugar epimerase